MRTNVTKFFDRKLKDKEIFCDIIVDFIGKGFYKPRPEKIRLPGSPPPADSVSLLIPDWPIFWIVNFVDLYWPIRIERERESAGGGEPLQSFFQVEVCTHPLRWIGEYCMSTVINYYYEQCNVGDIQSCFVCLFTIFWLSQTSHMSCQFQR